MILACTKDKKKKTAQHTFIELLLDATRTLFKMYIHAFSANYLKITCIDNTFLIERATVIKTFFY